MDDKNKSVSERERERWGAPGAGERGYAGEAGYAGERGFAADEPPADADRRTTAIRSEIEHTRAEMTETIDAIQDRLRPGNIVSRAAEGVRDATVGRMRQLTGSHRDDVPRRAADWYYGDSLLDRVRENPLPAAIAAASLVWLAFGKRASRDYEGPPYDRFDTGMPQSAYGSSPTYGSSSSSGGADLSSTSSALRAQVANTASDAVDRVRNASSDTGLRVKAAGRQTQRSVERFTQQNTLAAGAIAAAVGVAIGLALPETERENAIMGETRDSVVDRAKDAARGAAERVQETAQEVQRVASSAIAGTSRDSGNASQTNRDKDNVSGGAADKP